MKLIVLGYEHLLKIIDFAKNIKKKTSLHEILKKCDIAKPKTWLNMTWIVIGYEELLKKIGWRCREYLKNSATWYV